MADATAPSSPDDKAWGVLEQQLEVSRDEDGDAPPSFYPAPTYVSYEVPPSVMLRDGVGPAVISGGKSLLQALGEDYTACHSPSSLGADHAAETLRSQKTAGRVGEPSAQSAIAEDGAADAGEEADGTSQPDGAAPDAGHAGGNPAAFETGEAEAEAEASDAEDVGGDGEPAALETGEAAAEADESAGEEDVAGDAVEGGAVTLVPKPKRVLSAWAIWLEANHGGKISKSAGELWRALSEEERAPWVEKAAVDRVRHDAETARYKSALARGEANLATRKEGGGAHLAVGDGESALPMARVRRTMKASKYEVKAISKEAAFLISKSTELILGMLCEQTAEFARRERRKTVTLQVHLLLIYTDIDIDIDVHIYIYINMYIYIYIHIHIYIERET